MRLRKVIPNSLSQPDQFPHTSQRVLKSSNSDNDSTAFALVGIHVSSERKLPSMFLPWIFRNIREMKNVINHTLLPSYNILTFYL